MEFLESFWKYLSLTSPYLLGGFLLAGILKVLIPIAFIKKHLGKRGLISVIKASLLGIPLPLCSCSVIPTAVTIKKSGANNAATSAFLISTPESGVDSIAITYSLMDLPMTLIRPMAAFISALVAGVMQIFFNSNEIKINEQDDEQNCTPSDEVHEKKQTLKDKFITSIKYAYGELMDDMALWLFFGIVLGSLIDFFVPADFFINMNGIWGKFIVLAVGIPFYICASSSTPIAASMIVKGMSPGTAVIFLLVGPATNISNLLVIQKYIGKKGVLLNVISVAIVAFIISFAVDYFYKFFNLSYDFKVNGAHHGSGEYSWIIDLLSVIFLLLLIKGIYKSNIKKLFTKTKPEHCCSKD